MATMWMDRSIFSSVFDEREGEEGKRVDMEGKSSDEVVRYNRKTSCAGLHGLDFFAMDGVNTNHVHVLLYYVKRFFTVNQLKGRFSD